MAQWSSVRKGQLFRSSFTGASRSTGRWLTGPMDARQKARATVWGGRRRRAAMRQRIMHQPVSLPEEPQIEQIDRITVKDGSKIHLIKTDELIYIQACGDYVMLITPSG